MNSSLSQPAPQNALERPEVGVLILLSPCCLWLSNAHPVLEPVAGVVCAWRGLHTQPGASKRLGVRRGPRYPPAEAVAVLGSGGLGIGPPTQGTIL